MRLLASCCSALALSCSACFAPLKNLEEASAMEQQMTSAAVARCVSALDLTGVDRAKRYVLQVAAPTGVDTTLIRARLQHRLAEDQIRLQPDTASGAALARSPVIVAVLPVAGVDTEATLIGIPFVVPGMPVALGDISLYKSSTLTGRARLELTVWNADRSRFTAVSSTAASRYFRNISVLTFIGPFRFSDLDEPLPGEEP